MTPKPATVTTTNKQQQQKLQIVNKFYDIPVTHQGEDNPLSYE